MKNIIITGTCEVEVLGVFSLFESMGIPTTQLRDAQPEPGDLLIVSMSAEPLLGWAKYLPSLLAMKLWWRCSIVVLVPNKLASIRLLDSIGSIVSGGYSLAWTRNALMYLVAKWRQGEPLPVGDIHRFSDLPLLSIEVVAYFFAQTLPVKRGGGLSKTEYGRRNRAMVSMGFCYRHQLELFMVGVDPKIIKILWCHCLVPHSRKRADILQYVNADKLYRYLFSVGVY